MNLVIESNHESEFSPGDIVYARISFNSLTADYTAPFKFNLIGETEVNIMGIDRWVRSQLLICIRCGATDQRRPRP
jgi:hypothetical protein